MSTEYVRITPPEQVYGETNLLQSEVSLLTMLQQYQEYESLRKEELYLKIELKKKISEMKEFLDVIAKVLPESKWEEEQRKKTMMEHEMLGKIDSAVERAKHSEWKYWKEKEPKIKKVREIKEPPKKVKEIEEKPKKTPIEAELEEIQKKLSRLQ
jgi:hypothetical protein